MPVVHIDDSTAESVTRIPDPAVGSTPNHPEEIAARQATTPKGPLHQQPHNPHPAEQGLLGSGLDVFVVRGATELPMAMIGDNQFIAITVPGSPCDGLLCCSENGALALNQQLHEGLGHLQASRHAPPDEG